MQYEDWVALLPDYINGNLPEHQMTQVRQQLEQSTELRDDLNNLMLLHNSGSDWRDEPVPEWHRTAFLARRQKTNTGWLPWLSMATSFAAICLVVFRIEIVSTQDGFHVGFGQPTTQVAFQQQADQQLSDWRQEQEAYVSHKLLEFENQQLRRDQQLMAAVLELNKEQRRNELTQLTAYLAQQRNQDIEMTQSQYQTLFEIQEQDREKVQRIYASLNE
jgi:hypothetical protein